MKTKTILNITAFLLAVIGILLKALYLPGGSIAIILSAAIMLISLFMFAVKENKEAGLGEKMNYFLVGTLSFLIIGAIFKIQHWVGSSIFGVIGYSLAFLLPIIFFIQKSDFKISKQFFITFFTFFILVLGIMPNNPISKFIGRGWDFPLTGEEVTSKTTDEIKNN